MGLLAKKLLLWSKNTPTSVKRPTTLGKLDHPGEACVTSRFKLYCEGLCGIVKSIIFAWVALAECDHSLPKLNGSHPAGATHQYKQFTPAHAVPG